MLQCSFASRQSQTKPRRLGAFGQETYLPRLVSDRLYPPRLALITPRRLALITLFPRNTGSQTKYKPAAASATAAKAGKKKKGGLGKFRIPSKAKEQIALSDSTNTTP